MTTKMLRYVPEDGRPALDLTPHEAQSFDVAALDHAALVEASSSRDPAIRLTLRNVNAPKEVTGLEADGPLRLQGTWKDFLAYGLVDGGWVPLPWAHQRVAFLDRNILIELEKHGQPASAEDEQLRRALADLIGLDVHEVSAVLAAMEGATKRAPTDAEMEEELRRAKATIQRVLPGIRMSPVGPDQRRAMRCLLVDHAALHESATRVLVRAAPLVSQPLAPTKRLAVEQEILQIVREEKMRRSPLVVLALLSCIYDDAPGLAASKVNRPGAAVLKPKPVFTAEHAYNALADLYSLELMLNSRALFPDTGAVLYTRDLGLAAFWTALQPVRVTLTPTGPGRIQTDSTFSFDQAMFPALDLDGIEALVKRMTGEGVLHA